MNRLTKDIIYVLAAILCLSTLALLGYSVYKLAIIPRKYLVTGFGIILILILVLFLGLLSRRSVIKNISLSILIVLSLGFIFVSLNFNRSYNFISNLVLKYDTLNYSVIVRSDSNYQKLEDLYDKTIAYYNESDKIEKTLSKKITFNKKYMSESLLYSKLMDNEVDAIILEDGFLNLLREELDDFNSNTKVVYTFKAKVKAHKEKSKANLTKNPFILYISGIDMWGNVNSVRGRSDVNQILVINPNTKKILIVNTPRDYYVQLHGTTGLKDKLTHAGVYGISKSIETLEDLYDIDIDHYFRVNFDTLVKVVDTIDGVDIYSDKTFKSSHIRGWTVPEGWNHFDGKHALAYSRERYAYQDGDNHRGKNQQQVLEAIIDKLSNPGLLIKKYNAILNSLDGSLQTDIDKESLTSFIRYQIDENPKWIVETIQATGTGSKGYTYSMGESNLLWIMEPDYSSIKTIKTRINEILKGKAGDK